ncbi:MAG: hypothetical protein AAFV80_22470 [Bacteroidota bacterium]
MHALTIKDETASGKLLQEISLQFEKEYITVQELITARIKSEVDRIQQHKADLSSVLVLPKALERRLNRKAPKKIDVDKQVQIACKAFQQNGFFILIDDEQVEELDQQFLVDSETMVSFIKLTPLVGG